MLTDLEYTSAVMIGRYLQYLVSIGYSHNLFYLRTILAKVWGPIFLRPRYSREFRLAKPLTEEARINLAIALFDRIIETAPWQTYTPFEGVHKVILQENILAKSYVPDHIRDPIRIPYDPEQDKHRVPGYLRGTMSDRFKEESIKHAKETAKPECPIHPNRQGDQQQQHEPSQSGDTCPRNTVEFPPDQCQT
ncbi:unnamed protein product [Echinostoma caproni]|uniref:Complex I-B17 n=1 Tax=Echinostoma caproni TaxID=27848 RepID=A0A183AUM0_9TREM|nr:unnamed protein product [Echinostoma caproni]